MNDPAGMPPLAPAAVAPALPTGRGALRHRLLLALGWLNVAIAIVGALVPLVPTTIFLLIAIWCFARSSPRFADWLYGHRTCGHALRRWRDARIVPLRAKVLATLSMATSLALAHAFCPELAVANWTATGLCIAVACYLWSRPHESDAGRPAVTAILPVDDRSQEPA